MMNMSSSTFTQFILNSGKYDNIQIPLIQRDYVQGRKYENNPKVEENRRDFVTKLLDSILNGTPITLDFIYGARETYGFTNSSSSANPFLPLDGQQRLTTLFLLHWVLMQKDQLVNFDARQELLSHFSYKTRISSDRFCQKIVGTKFILSKSLCAQIESSYWFDKDMKSDLTVQAMMMMIELIEEMLNKPTYSSSISQMADNLFYKDIVTFEILDMNTYGLTDGLYVKMNARGKELTDFENWKAGFIGFLSQWDEEKERFTNSIEHEWNDLFWKYSYGDYVAGIKSSPVIDNRFLLFFYNVTRLFFFRQNNNLQAEDYKPGTWEQIKSVYAEYETRKELFDMLDALVKIGDLNKFFNDLFYLKCNYSWSSIDERVRLFKDQIDLFNSICTDKDFQASHFLLYALLYYCNRHHVWAVDDDMRRYMRIVRNYLEEHNYFAANTIEIIQTIRVVEIRDYINAFKRFANYRDAYTSLNYASGNTYIEKEKSKLKYYNSISDDVRNLTLKLEDLSYAHGNLSAFISQLNLCSDNTTLCQLTWNAMREFRYAEPLDKVRLFLNYGYKGINVKDCAYGKAVFMGSEFKNTARWAVHFRRKYDQQNPLDKWFVKYVDDFSKKGNIPAITSLFATITPTTTVDYMLKYAEICASQLYWRMTANEQAPFYYAMAHPWNDLDIITIHSFSSSPLRSAYQVCPMSHAVCCNMISFNRYFNSHRIGYSGIRDNKNGICINRAADDWDNLIFRMVFGRYEWIVEIPYFANLSPALQGRLKSIIDTNGIIIGYELVGVAGKDLIENATDFMNDVVNWFVSQKKL